MSRHLISSSLIVVLLCACSHAPPPAAAVPAATATLQPQAGQPGAAVNAVLSDTEIQALQKARGVESQVLQQQHDVDKKVDEQEAGKN